MHILLGVESLHRLSPSLNQLLNLSLHLNISIALYLVYDASELTEQLSGLNAANLLEEGQGDLRVVLYEHLLLALGALYIGAVVLLASDHAEWRFFSASAWS